MVQVPQYQQTERLRPNLRQGIDVQASPNAFGAQEGRAMGQLAQGMANFGEAMQRVQELEDATVAKERDNAYADWAREAMYGDNGFLTKQGRNAVDGRKAFEEAAEAKRKELAGGLSPGAARAFEDASRARVSSVKQQSAVHTANERKSWITQTSAARLDTFTNDALVNYRNPAMADKNIAAGILELREIGQLQGWDADTFKSKEAEFLSGVHTKMALRIAQDDPLAADRYIKSKSTELSADHQFQLREKLDGEIKLEQSKRYAEEIISGKRGGGAPAVPATADPASGGRAVAPAQPAERTAGQSGPTSARAFLYAKTDKPKAHIDGLNENFATNLAAMIQDAPPEIREGLGIYSGHRSVDRQRELFAAAIQKYGSAAAARKWVAPPGRSNHNHGKAADLSWNGRSLKHAPANVVAWVHSNAGKYGMHFPMSWENWHIEPKDARGGSAGPVRETVVARSDAVAPRTTLPSFDEIEARLQSIPDETTRDLTRKRIYSVMEAQSKAVEAQEKAAKADLWRYVDQGMNPDQIPMEVRQAAGMAAVSAAWQYTETVAKGREVDDDDTLAYDMRRFAALKPEEFAEIDLNEYRDRLSKQTIKDMTALQTSALSDTRKAREEGLNITAAFSQSSAQLAAVGLTTEGKKGEAREEAAKRIARFQNALASEMQAFRDANDNRMPTQMEIQKMTARLLLPITIKTPGTLWDSEEPGLMFEAPFRADKTTVDVAIEYTDIPADLRAGIARDLALQLGREPSQDEVVSRYEEFVTRQ